VIYVTKVKTAKQAVAIAREFLEDAGLTLSVVTKTIHQEDMWLIEATTIMGTYRLKIDEETGDVIEYGSV